MSRTAPKLLGGNPLMGFAAELSEPDTRTFYETGFHRVGGDAYRVRVGPPRVGTTMHVFRSPQAMHDVLGAAGSEIFTRDGNRFFEVFRDLFGHGLFSSEGEQWLGQRRALSPLFARGRIEDYTPLMRRHVEALVPDLMASGGPIDLKEVGRRISLGVVTEALFGAQPEGLTERVGDALAALSAYQMDHMMHPLQAPARALRKVPLAFVRKGEAAIAEVDAILDEVMAAGGPDESALVAQLQSAQDPETGEGFSDEEIRDQVLTFFIAGQETTSSVLTMTLQLLGSHPEEQRQVIREVAEFGVPSTIEEANRLVRTTACIDEAMRLYPPAYVTSRMAHADAVVDGWSVPKGDLAVTSFAALHRHPDLWPAPAAFMPQRFVDLPALKHPRHTLLPFGAGPRACIGAQFAILEAQVLLAGILSHMEVTTLTRDVRMRTDVTLQVAEPVWALVRPLEPVAA